MDTPSEIGIENDFIPAALQSNPVKIPEGELWAPDEWAPAVEPDTSGLFGGAVDPEAGAGLTTPDTPSGDFSFPTSNSADAAAEKQKKDLGFLALSVSWWDSQQDEQDRKELRQYAVDAFGEEFTQQFEKESGVTPDSWLAGLKYLETYYVKGGDKDIIEAIVRYDRKNHPGSNRGLNQSMVWKEASEKYKKNWLAYKQELANQQQLAAARQQKLTELFANLGSTLFETAGGSTANTAANPEALANFAAAMEELQIPDDAADEFVISARRGMNAYIAYNRWYKGSGGELAGIGVKTNMLPTAFQLSNGVARTIADQLKGEDGKMDALGLQVFKSALLAAKRAENAQKSDSTLGNISQFGDAVDAALFSPVQWYVNAQDSWNSWILGSDYNRGELEAVQAAITEGNATMTDAQQDDNWAATIAKMTGYSTGMFATLASLGTGAAIKGGAAAARAASGSGIMARAAAGLKGGAGALSKSGIAMESVYMGAETDRQRLINISRGAENPLLEAAIDTGISRSVERIAFGGLGKFAVSNKLVSNMLTRSGVQRFMAKGAQTVGLKRATAAALRGLAWAETHTITRGILNAAGGVAEETIAETAAEQLLQGGVRGGLRALGVNAAAYQYKNEEGQRTESPLQGTAMAVWDTVTDPVMVASTLVFCAGITAAQSSALRRQAQQMSTDIDLLKNTGITPENAIRIARETDPETRLQKLDEALKTDIAQDPEGARTRLAARGEELVHAREIALYADSGVRDYILQKAGVLDIQETPDGKKYRLTLRQPEKQKETGEPATPATAQPLQVDYTESQLNAWLEMQAENSYIDAMRLMQASISGERLAQAKPTAESVKGEIINIRELPTEALARMQINGGIVDQQVLDALAEDAAETIDGLVGSGANRQTALSMPSPAVRGATLGAVMDIGAGFRQRTENARATGELPEGVEPTAPVLRLDAATPGQSILLYNSGHVSERAMQEDLIERDLIDYVEEAGIPLEEVESYLRDVETILRERVGENIRLFPEGKPEGHATRQDIIEAFSTLAQADFLANYEGYHLPDWANVSLEYVTKRLGDTQKLVALSHAWQAFADSEQGKAWQQTTGQGLSDLLRHSGIALASQYEAARDSWQQAFSPVQQAAEGQQELPMPISPETARIAGTQPTQEDLVLGTAATADDAAMEEAAEDKNLLASLTDDDRARLTLTQAAPWLQGSPLMQDAQGNYYMAGEGGSEWRNIPASSIRPAKGLPKITPAPPAEREATRPPILWRRKNGQLELIYGKIPEGAENVTAQIFDETDEPDAAQARQAAYRQAVENIEPLKRIVEAAAKAVGGKAVMRPENKENGLATKAPSTAFAKAERDYNGDISRVVDLIGGTCVLPESGSYTEAVEAIRAALPAGCSIAKVKKLGFNKKNPCYQDVKVSIRFANGGIGEVILVSEFMNDAKFNRGGHAVYELSRVLENYTDNLNIKMAYEALRELSSAIYSTEVDSAAFSRAKAKASSALQCLREEDINSLSSSNDMMVVKSSSSLLKAAIPLSVNSAAIPSSSEIEKDISNANVAENDGKVNNKKEKTRLAESAEAVKDYRSGVDADGERRTRGLGERRDANWARSREIAQRMQDGAATAAETAWYFTQNPMNEGAAEEAGLRPRTESGNIDATYLQGKAQAETNASAESTLRALAAGAKPRVGRIPTKDLQLSSDVPQWKEGANEQGESQPLTAEKWDERGIAPLSIWVRADGALEVISGRHRRALALRLGVADVPCEFYYETDGFSATDAKLLDAELNIRDGNGSAKDFARYVRTTGISAEEARARGWMGGRAQSNGVKIAVYGGESLYNSFINGQISETAAAWLAEAAPGEDGLQRVGMREIQERKKSADYAISVMQAVQSTQGNSGGGDMGDFLFDMMDDSALDDARRMAEYATRMKRALARMVKSAEGAVKNPEAFSKVTKSEIRSELKAQETLARLKWAQSRWNNYGFYHELAEEASNWDEKSPVTLNIDTLPPLPINGSGTFALASAEYDVSGLGSILEEKAFATLLNDARKEAARWRRVFARKETPATLAAQGMGRISALMQALYKRLPSKYRPKTAAALRLMEHYARTLESGRIYKNSKQAEPEWKQAILDEINAAGLETADKDYLIRAIAGRNLNQLATDLLEQTADAMEQYLKDAELERIKKLARRLEPGTQKNGKPARGKMRADAYRQFREYMRMAALTDAETEAEMAQAETQLQQAQDNDDDAAMAEAENRLKALTLFGDLANQELEAIRRARAELENFVKRERESWNAKLTDEREKTRHEAMEAARGLKEAGVLPERTERALAEENRQLETLPERYKSMARTLRSISQTFHRLAAVKGLRPIMEESLDAISNAHIQLSNREIGLSKRFEQWLADHLGLDTESKRGQWLAELNRVQDTGIRRPWTITRYTLRYTLEEARQLLEMGATGRAAYRQQKREEAAAKGWETEALLQEEDIAALNRAVAEAEKNKRKTIRLDIERRDASNRNGELDVVYSKNQLLNHYLRCQRPRYKEQAATQGWTPDVMDKIARHLGADVLAFGEYMRQELNNSGLKEVFEEREGVPFASEENYWPGTFDLSDKITEKDALESAAAVLGGSRYTMLIRPVRHSRQFDMTMGATNVFLSNIAMHNNYICVGTLTRKWRRLLACRPFAQGLRLQLGSRAFSQLKQAIDMLDGAGVAEAASHKAFSNMLGVVQSAHALAVLALNPITMLKQTSGIFNGKAYAGISLPAFLAQMAQDALHQGKASYADIASLPAFQARHSSNKYFLSLMSMGQDFKFSSLDRLAHWGMDWIEWADIKSNLIAMTAIYNQRWNQLEKANETAASPLTEEEMHSLCEQTVNNALELAAQPLRQTQKSLFAALSPGNLFVRVAGYMGSDALNKLGYAVTQWGRAGGGLKGFFAGYKYIAGFSLAEQAILALIEIGRNAGLDDDDDWQSFILGNFATALTGTTLLANMPLLGKAFEEFTKRITGGTVYARTGAMERAVLDISGSWRAARKMEKMLTDDEGHNGAELTIGGFNLIRFGTLALALGTSKMSKGFTSTLALLQSVNAVGNFLRPALQTTDAALEKADPEHQKKQERKRKRKEREERRKQIKEEIEKRMKGK